MAESVGWKLQQARLARRLEIEDVAETTKIRPERIIDLEADEYRHFPNLTYAKSFLAKYAKFLEVDIQDELDKFQVGRTISLAAYQYLTGPPVPKHFLEPRFVGANRRVDSGLIELIGQRVPESIRVVRHRRRDPVVGVACVLLLDDEAGFLQQAEMP